MRSAMTMIACVLVFNAAALAQRFSETLNGMILMSVDSGLPAPVRIQLQKSGIIIQEMFARDSRFEFYGLPSGRYTLIVEANGFETVRQDVTVPGDWPVLELRRRRGPAASTTGAEVIPLVDLKIPESARREFVAGQNKLQENDCAHALVHLQKAVRSYAEYGDAHLNMGECYFRLGRLEDAERELKLALEQPHRPELHVQLGKIYRRQGNQSLLERQIEYYDAEQKP